MKTCLFPGQGSQAKGMGRQLFDRFPELTAQADHVLGYSIRELCVDDPQQRLKQTLYTQPAIFVVSALAWYDYVASHGKPDALAGHSLGEFNALLAADAFSFETGLRLVRRRAELMHAAADGAMAAVLNLDLDRITAILHEHGLDAIDIANLNAPSQTVISGARDQVAAFAPLAEQAHGHVVPLNTSGAFHSRYMEPARQQFEAFLASFDFRAPAIPVIANVTAQPYQPGAVAANLARQITGTVRWHESMAYLLAQDPGQQMVELGHGEVLTNLLKKIRSAARPVPAIGSPATAGERVRAWNLRHPVGTRVRSAMVAGATLATRTEAVVLFQHRPAVYLDGYQGYFDLDELQPV
ncbi:malonyl CoA-ACP transacylase [Duganella sp. Leaf126]|uniref:ACP S-malonyltransferase n=1 Tax=Duganella sp. Leaf126 TaxID=1736266 RepID=UPI0006F24DE4|nr:ACP S-malonyltransferase [Duganella sp. Leaf126]KQQ40264.1 malonyl CoA-ACP transacylase [Duganella sp. Leaf126]